MIMSINNESTHVYKARPCFSYLHRPKHAKASSLLPQWCAQCGWPAAHLPVPGRLYLAWALNSQIQQNCKGAGAQA